MCVISAGHTVKGEIDSKIHPTDHCWPSGACSDLECLETIDVFQHIRYILKQKSYVRLTLKSNNYHFLCVGRLINILVLFLLQHLNSIERYSTMIIGRFFFV